MPSIVYKCNKCLEFSKNYENESSYCRSSQEYSYTDASYLYNRKVFLRCPYCYNIMEAKESFIESKGNRVIVKKRKAGEKYKKSQLLTTTAKCIELNLMEYYDLLSNHLLSEEQEINIRVHILVLENNKRRESQNKDYPVVYNNKEINNFIQLEKLLNLESHYFLLVEVKRYLKKFDEAKIQLECLHDVPNTRFYIGRFDKENELIKQKNIYVSHFILGDEAKNNLRSHLQITKNNLQFKLN